MSVSLNFGAIREVAPHLTNSVRSVCIWYAANRAAGTLTSAFHCVKDFLRTVPVDRAITSTDLLNYRAALSREKEWYLGHLRSVLKKWHALGYPGISDDAIALMNEIRIRGQEKGKAVLTMDIEDGPYSDIELEAIYAALNKSYADGQTSLEEYVLVWLFVLLGQRPCQYASLKVCDVIPPSDKEKSPHYILRMPRAKQPGQLARSQFKERFLTPQVGRLIVRYAEQCRQSFVGRLDDPDQAPLFPTHRDSGTQPKLFAFHRTNNNLGRFLSDVLKRLNINSERTEAQLHVTGTRFRRTIGTRAAREGHGELVIAELLDHSDTQNVGVYVQATPEIVERIDRAVAMHLAPLAKAFAGKLLYNESEATRAGDPSSRISDPRFSTSVKPIASCGKHGFCGFSAPIACYTCPSFEPWLDGPHEAVLEYLLAERERLSKNADIRIASINDRTILAVAQVIQECQEVKQGSKEVDNG